MFLVLNAIRGVNSALFKSSLRSKYFKVNPIARIVVFSNYLIFLPTKLQKIPKESITDRQKWPYPILKSVVEELIDETPRDLLSRYHF